jgi:hypothetical protein
VSVSWVYCAPLNPVHLPTSCAHATISVVAVRVEAEESGSFPRHPYLSEQANEYEILVVKSLKKLL